MQELRNEPRQRRSQESIDAILDAAERLIHDDGQVSFTAAELAAAAEMSIGRVYYWFPDIPAVVNALVERTVQRMVEVFGAAIGGEAGASTPLFIQRVVGALCNHIDANPATVALALVGSHANHEDALHNRMVELARYVVTERVRDIPEGEAELVARTTIGITLGMLHGYTGAGDLKPLLRQELVYVLSAWLYARYPSSDDPVWNDPTWPLQPSRLPSLGYVENSPVWPALAPNQPSGV
ncbi:MAG TPA: TetR/AcrR family transcriptional regulator [Ilumatobacteraceae bacterium]|nr:TetR/AcrR family transcriptional regulator [Ilumatobacteraceae bacterium]HRB01835.1 TetR/AcrR family transcriptional regulator [Ilumatobacteraceae bacterium]